MPSAHDPAVIALDLSGTFGEGMRGAVLTGDAGVAAGRQGITPLQTGELVEAVISMATRLKERAAAEGAAPVGIGVAIPGIVDEQAGAVRRSPNLAIQGGGLREAVEGALRLPTFLVQNVRAGLVAESLLGSARGVSEALLVTVGAGVGSAIMTHGQVLAGAHGAAGEIGHISVDPGGPKCGCGGRGCLETFASEPWLARRYTLASRQAVLGREVVKRAATGDADAARVWEQAVGALALTIGTAVVLLDCELVILAGVLANGDLASAIAARLETRIKLVSPPPGEAGRRRRGRRGLRGGGGRLRAPGHGPGHRCLATPHQRSGRATVPTGMSRP